MPIYLPTTTLTLSSGDVQASAEYILFWEKAPEITVTRSGQSWFRPIYRQPGEVLISYTSSLHISSWRAETSQIYTIPGEFQITGNIGYFYVGCASYTSSGIHILPVDSSQTLHASTTEHTRPAIPDISGAILRSHADTTLVSHNLHTRQNGIEIYLHHALSSITIHNEPIYTLTITSATNSSVTSVGNTEIQALNGAILNSPPHCTITSHHEYTRQGGVHTYTTQAETSNTYDGSTKTSLSLSSSYSKTITQCGYHTLPDGTTIRTRGFKTISRTLAPTSKRIQKPAISVVIAASVHDITKQRGSASISSHGFQLISGGAEIRSINNTAVVRDGYGVAIRDTIFVHARLSKYETNVHVVLQVM